MLNLKIKKQPLRMYSWYDNIKTSVVPLHSEIGENHFWKFIL